MGCYLTRFFDVILFLPIWSDLGIPAMQSMDTEQLLVSFEAQIKPIFLIILNFVDKDNENIYQVSSKQVFRYLEASS